MGNYVGLLIRHKRLEQNLSQQGLCRGICVVSYLSKIEQGLADPSPEIVRQLLGALGVEYTTDPPLIAQGQARIEGFFERMGYGEDPDPQADEWLAEQAQRLQNSPLYLDQQLYELFRAGWQAAQLPGPLPAALWDRVRRLEPFVPYMSPTQQYRYYWGASLATHDHAQRQGLLQKAALLQPGALILFWLAHAYSAAGQYIQAVEQAERAYQAAAEEGNLYVLRWAALFIGTCYTGYPDPDLQLCRRYFRRALALARGADTPIPRLVQYNLGASYVERRRYAEALPHLEEALRLGSARQHRASEDDLVLTLHKLALAYGGTGQAQKAREACDQAEKLLAACPHLPPVCADMIRLARMRLQPGYLDDPGYAQLLQRVYDTVEQSFSFGFKRFHGFMLVDLYRHQRRYKEALAISEANSSNFPTHHE